MLSLGADVECLEGTGVSLGGTKTWRDGGLGAEKSVALEGIGSHYLQVRAAEIGSGSTPEICFVVLGAGGSREVPPKRHLPPASVPVGGRKSSPVTRTQLFLSLIHI